MGSADLVADSKRFPQSQKEVVKMKFCSTCREEFADKFSFCPVDGTPLNAPVAEPEQKVVRPPSASEPVRVNAPVFAAAGSAALWSVANSSDNIDETAWLAGSQKTKDVAHEYQLTWPELSVIHSDHEAVLIGYGQMISKFFANRNVNLRCWLPRRYGRRDESPAFISLAVDRTSRAGLWIRGNSLRNFARYLCNLLRKNKVPQCWSSCTRSTMRSLE